MAIVMSALLFMGQAGAYEILNGPSQLIQYNASKAYEGYTLLTHGADKKSYLIDMVGNVVHTWDHSPRTPGLNCVLLENGNLLGGYRLPPKEVGKVFLPLGGRTGGLVELDWDGNVVWQFELSSDTEILHHDFVRLPNGNTLTNSWEHIPYDEAIKAGRREDQTTRLGVVSDVIYEINPEGKIVWKWRAWDHRGTNSKVKLDINFITYVLPEYPHENQDWTHFNAVDYDPVSDRILVSSREFGEFYIIDHKNGDILYRWGNPSAYSNGDPPTFSTQGDQKLFGPHDAHFIKPGLPGEGNIMIFNNGWGRSPITYSSIVEMNPETGDILWEYKSKAETSFAAHHVSGAQRLPNGNTLICSGIAGHLFEATSKGEIVWEYINPLTNSGAKNWIEDAEFPPTGPDANILFRAYRYGQNNPALKERSLKPRGQIAEDLKEGWKPKVDLTGATQPGVELWKKIWE